ncbi:MAG: hypothetical protein ACLQLG_02245 [Thermoguttaceae bacterium]
MRRSLLNPRVVLLGATTAAAVVLLIASVMAYCSRPRVAVTPGAVFISVVVPEGRRTNQAELIRRLNAPEFAEQLKAATRHRRLLSRLVAEEPISFSITSPEYRGVAVHGWLPRMCAVESSRYELVRWLQQRLPGMPDSAELIELQTEADALNREARDVIDSQVKQVIEAVRFPFPKEWRAACQLTDELRERFMGIGFGIAEAGSGKIVIDIFGANAQGKADQILDEVHFAKQRVGIVGDVKLRFFEAQPPHRGTSEAVL